MIEYGAVVAVPMGEEFAKNSTFEMDPWGAAVAEAPMFMAFSPTNEDPFAGVEMRTDGGVSTRRSTGADVTVAPRVSVARAVSV